MMLHEVLPALIEGKVIRQKSVHDLHYVIGKTGGPPVLVAYVPTSIESSFTTNFDADDILSDEWEIVP